MNKLAKQAVMEFNQLTNTPIKFNVENNQDLLRLIYSNGGSDHANIVFHEDSGHGWLQVPHSYIDKLGIKKDISNYSYRDTENAYLEEDCDLSVFMRAIGLGHEDKEPESKTNLRQNFWEICPIVTTDYSPIRNKKHY